MLQLHKQFLWRLSGFVHLNVYEKYGEKILLRRKSFSIQLTILIPNSVKWLQHQILQIPFLLQLQ